MRAIFLTSLLLLTVVSGALAQHADSRYVLSHTGKDQVEVTLHMQPLEQDSTLFHYGMVEFGGQADLFKAVTGIRGEHVTGIRIDEQAHSITVHHRARKPFTLHYVITDTHTQIGRAHV